MSTALRGRVVTGAGDITDGVVEVSAGLAGYVGDAAGWMRRGAWVP
jgi:hypothetical protein